MQDPVVGGLTKEKIALRRAMAMAYNVDEEIKVVRNGQAVEAQFPIPPGVVGHDPDYKSQRQVRPGRRQRAARHVRLQEGRRRLAQAARRQAARRSRYASRPDSLGRQQDELWKKSLDAIGIRMEVQKDKFPELLKLEKQCKLHDAHGVVDRRLPGRRQLHAAPVRPEHRPEQQRLRDDSRVRQALRADRSRMPDSPERNKLYHEMARIIEAYAPWRLDISRYRNMLVQPRVQGFKKHPILHAEWQYIDVGAEATQLERAECDAAGEVTRLTARDRARDRAQEEATA